VDAARTGRVTATVSPAEGTTLVTWKRPTAGARDADRVIDSLHTALARRGLTRRACGAGAVPAGRLRTVAWRDARLLVPLSRIAPPTGAPRLVVVAADDLIVLPPALCRNVVPRRDA
jgi:hypothetical protein